MMGIAACELRDFVIRPALKKIGLWSLSAENLLLGTAAQESRLGYYLHQRNGPALGIYQIEPRTHYDIWENFLKYQPTLSALATNIASKDFIDGKSADELITNLKYSTVIARLVYFRSPKELPDAEDMDGLAAYWKEIYNTDLGKGTKEEFIKNYKELVLS